ncbi:hypothetical protein HPG69_015514 [Diceros bicornis minor]|uniref:Small ribosomal subunit protein uS5 C-terminal domain-containing protein n=1 Tax=Diceros bicornis minor TaxID=77932 RepID=A0A7J7FM55_DICBM|nr:hypothetical protein HPG69_015514 [Diceros bicornis minor]
MAGIDNYYSVRGCTATLGNFAKATFDANSKTYSYLTLSKLWKKAIFTKFPYQEFTDHLAKAQAFVAERTCTVKISQEVHYRPQADGSWLWVEGAPLRDNRKPY